MVWNGPPWLAKPLCRRPIAHETCSYVAARTSSPAPKDLLSAVAGFRGPQARTTSRLGRAADPRGTSRACPPGRPAAGDRVLERRRAVALARHFRDTDGLWIEQIADRAGRAPARIKACFGDPRETVRAVKARSVGGWRGCGAYTEPSRCASTRTRCAAAMRSGRGSKRSSGGHDWAHKGTTRPNRLPHGLNSTTTEKQQAPR